jgi:class 3 adenylate cyclase
MIIVHYEVYVQESRGWMLHARFPRLERDEAIREAKELETTLRIRVKVVRETYNTDDNSFDEAEVYLSGMVRKQAQPKAGAPRAAPRGGGKPTAGKATARSARPQPGFAPRQRQASTGSAGGVLWRLMLICLVGVSVALGAVRATPEIVIFLFDYGVRFSPDLYGQLLFAVFVGVFLMVSVPLAFRFLPKNAELNIRKPAFGWSRKQAIDSELKRSLNTLVTKAAAGGQQPEVELPQPAEEVLPEIKPDDLEEALPDIRPGDDEEKLPDIRPGDDEKPLPPITAESAAGRDIDGLNVVSMRFLGGAINAVKTVSPTLDKFSKFALNLYMAGAVESLGETKRLDEASQRKLLGSLLETLGTSGDIAARFHDKVSDYMVEPRYMQIIQTGRNAMDAWMAGEEAQAHGPLASALKDFNKPVGEKRQSIMTVMFTDMVGSTDLTQARGDVAAQEVVRRHNAIVRTALAQFLGKEIKHTGDGIMASFSSAANAVEATVIIQRQVALTNQKSPDLGLHLRIGLNAGEPIQEEDDLFGTTVQLAARVCAATETDEILCTQVVRDLSFGKTVAFRPAGDHALKGFKEKLPLFEVVWRE